MSRTCERCGGKASPFIPRTRLDDGRLVCAGCAQAVSRERTAGARERSDHWHGELADDRFHPLLQPLPQSVWDRFNSSRRTAAGEPGFPSDFVPGIPLSPCPRPDPSKEDATLGVALAASGDPAAPGAEAAR